MYVRKINSRGIRRLMSSSAQQNAMIEQVTKQQQERTARVVPWFLQNMPVSLVDRLCIHMMFSVITGPILSVSIGFLLQLHP